MMDSPQIISTYEALLGVTGKMLEAARNSDWDGLIELEQECKNLVEKLMREGSHPVSEKYHRRKVEVIHKVLANDAEIRNLAEPWMAQLQQFIGSVSQERKLQQVYGADFAPY